MTRSTRVAVIGGGIVGCAVLYGLAKRGWSDALLLERRQLTSGSTWHAAGNTTYFGPYAAMTRLFTGSIKTYLEAEALSGQSVGFHQTGSLRLATSEAELAAYRALEPLYAGLDIPYHVISPAEVAGIYPLLNVDDLCGAAHTPTDGHVDASGATYALARAARQSGAGIMTNTPVGAIERAGSRWRIRTDDDMIEADHVVLAASFWTRELAEPLGLNLPLYAVQHHEFITERVAALAANPVELPTVRDPRAPANIRQERDGFLCGVYEQNPEFWAIDGIPKDFTEELLPPDLDRLMPELERVIERLPCFGETGIKTVNNGPICYTPDGMPLLGPVAGLPGMWLASGFTVGIGTGGGAGDYLAHWMVNGAPEYDLAITNPARFPNDMDRATILARIAATYAAGYALK
ncbi:NAD(P)/FAD-dependent oxidoreductase [Microbulbifer sp. S227A]|uniref:NAD(P)/FAD-dependent oxidoreductase n=1 Tax=Microbulbifer sp. S227A TaxID=3415131 RepID=UPI003C7B6246